MRRVEGDHYVACHFPLVDVSGGTDAGDAVPTGNPV
jgi:hypothetical protein